MAGVIYEPKGKAREYSDLALNLYTGCSHGCKYCYAPRALFMDAKTFFESPQPKKDILERLEKDAAKLANDKRHVLLCFTCDPYQPLERDLQLTRQAIKILRENNIRFKVLTKSELATRDFDLYTKYDWFGVTLTCLSHLASEEWEPKVDNPSNRIRALKIASMQRIKTWVSLEPVIYPEQTLELIRRTHEFVDHYKVGKLNYKKPPEKVDWKKFTHDVVNLFEKLGCDYYIKEDLRKYLETGDSHGIQK